MSDIVRFGILGSGGVANGFAAGLRSVPGATLAGVASRDVANARAFAARHGEPRVHESYEALAEDPGIDVIYVATPNDRHAGDALLCLTHDKPVLCEKPFTVDGDEARRVIAEARQRHLFCMEGMWMRFIPAIQRVAQLVADGAIGEVRMLSADFSHAVRFDPASRFFDPDRGGGALLDLGVYTLSLAQLLLGEPDSVSGRLDVGATGVDEQAAVVLGYSDGATAVLTSSLTVSGANAAVIAGTEGTIRLAGPICAPTRFTVERHSPRDATGVWKDESRFRRLLQANPTVERAARAVARSGRALAGQGARATRLGLTGNGYDYEAAEVVRCLRAGEIESPLMPLDDSLRVVELMDRIRRDLTPG